LHGKRRKKAPPTVSRPKVEPLLTDESRIQRNLWFLLELRDVVEGAYFLLEGRHHESNRLGLYYLVDVLHWQGSQLDRAREHRLAVDIGGKRTSFLLYGGRDPSLEESLYYEHNVGVCERLGSQI